ncbi:hypothetical protein SLEP1_g49711 [Rubroshorea leprosula]|uniref:Cellulose synthase-like protein G2 n=1 Tax=Rubroshorea leprosula TaxID=152421 RepID=A0AAV5M0Z9_9ROSI|nr:hypothetical protein SLEP1_g49711 [Rubroshorea leprosula]
MENSLPLPLPLHTCHVHSFSILVNRSHALLHFTALASLIFYRASFLFTRTNPILPWLLVFAAEFLLSLMWTLGQAYRWRLVSRTVYPERLPSDDKLPGIDVFICTVDPDKEPTVDVMNTVLSAMALDYPPEKLHVYLSDDGGSPITLQGMKEAWRFALWWLPFCRRYDVKTRCPKAFFGGSDEDLHQDLRSPEFFKERKNIKEKYENFKEAIIRAKEDSNLYGNAKSSTPRDHPSVVEVIEEHPEDSPQENQVKMPLLVYVAREKRPSHPHHFKAGALNVLLRVSALLSNSPYLLVLDCDMYCNDPTSARQAMCFHFDPTFSSSLGFVQFPQRFHNNSQKDVYDSEIRYIFSMAWNGFDGLRGPILSGSNFYIKRKALCSGSRPEGINLEEVKSTFGPSNEFIKSLQDHKHNLMINERNSMEVAKVLASCAYEDETKWGEKACFLYHSLVEDVFTGFTLHCKGWRSVYLNPRRPQFLGTGITSLNDRLVQGTRWAAGCAEICFSRFSPLIYGPQQRMSLLQTMGYAEVTFIPLLYSTSVWCFATIPQLCLLNGIPLYPEVSSPYFSVFLFIFLSALFKHLYEVLTDGRPIRTWRNEQRIWMIQSVTCQLYGTLDAVMKLLGLREASFMPTNKVMDGEQMTRYEKGVIDFQASTMFVAPLATIAIVNVASLVGGIIRMVIVGDWRRMLGQVLLSCYILVMNYAIIEAMVIRKDKGRIPLNVTLLSVAFSVIFLSFGSIILIMSEMAF